MITIKLSRHAVETETEGDLSYEINSWHVDINVEAHGESAGTTGWVSHDVNGYFHTPESGWSPRSNPEIFLNGEEYEVVEAAASLAMQIYGELEEAVEDEKINGKMYDEAEKHEQDMERFGPGLAYLDFVGNDDDDLY